MRSGDGGLIPPYVVLPYSRYARTPAMPLPPLPIPRNLLPGPCASEPHHLYASPLLHLPVLTRTVDDAIEIERLNVEKCFRTRDDLIY